MKATALSTITNRIIPHEKIKLITIFRCLVKYHIIGKVFDSNSGATYHRNKRGSAGGRMLECVGIQIINF